MAISHALGSCDIAKPSSYPSIEDNIVSYDLILNDGPFWIRLYEKGGERNIGKVPESGTTSGAGVLSILSPGLYTRVLVFLISHCRGR